MFEIVVQASVYVDRDFNEVEMEREFSSFDEAYKWVLENIPKDFVKVGSPSIQFQNPSGMAGDRAYAYIAEPQYKFGEFLLSLLDSGSLYVVSDNIDLIVSDHVTIRKASSYNVFSDIDYKEIY